MKMVKWKLSPGGEDVILNEIREEIEAEDIPLQGLHVGEVLVTKETWRATGFSINV